MNLRLIFVELRFMVKMQEAGRGYAKIIQDYSSKSLEKIFNIHISNDAKITTDGWSGYKPIMKNHPHYEQKLSDKGQNLKILYI